MERDKRRNEDILHVKWNKKEDDFLVHYPRKCDSALIIQYLFSDFLRYNPLNKNGYEHQKSLIDELELRGYDIKTLEFSIKLKPNIKR